jgi:hypothetical protein
MLFLAFNACKVTPLSQSSLVAVIVDAAAAATATLTFSVITQYSST